MQTAVARKKEDDKSAAPKSAPTAEHRVDRKDENILAPASTPIFLKRLATAAPPPIQLQTDDEALQPEPIDEEAPAEAILPKLIVGPPDDEYEREADEVAERVQRMSDTAVAQSLGDEDEKLLARRPQAIQTKPLTPRYLQRLCADCNEELEQEPPGVLSSTIQTKAEAATTAAPSSHVRNAVSSPSGGSPLADNVKAKVEPVLGHGLGHVRVHTDTNSHRAARDLGAKAFTHQNHIWLGAGQSASDESLMAHELTHVLQQRHRFQSSSVQRTMGDGHDLQSPRFTGNLRLEAAFDDESYVRIGTRGEHVLKLQQALVDSGHPLPKYGVDGIFGSETHGSVKSYQADRALQIDGIVGPETMGDLDRLYAKGPPQPEIPPGLPDICTLLLSDQHALADENGLIAFDSIKPENRKAADKLPKVNLPDGGTAVECKTPSTKKTCGALCGCPFPNNTQYKAKVGDLAQVMENATSFHEKDPKPNQDPRRLLCPPKGEPIKVLSIIPSAGITFLKVLFCNGALADKNGTMVSEVFIQQRFVENGKPLSIKGYHDIYTSIPEQLTADGAHKGSKAVWSIEKDYHDDKSMGRVYFLGSNKKSVVTVKGAIDGDVIVKVSVCGKSALHKLLVKEWPASKPKPIPKPKPKLKYTCGKGTDKPSKQWALKFNSYMANPFDPRYNVGIWFDLKNKASNCEYDAEFWGKLKKGAAGGFSLSDSPKYVDFDTTIPLQPIDFGNFPWAELLDLPLPPGAKAPLSVGVLKISPDNRVVGVYVEFRGIGAGLGGSSARFEGPFAVK